MAHLKSDSVIFGGNSNTIIDIDYYVTRDELEDANSFYTPRKVRFVVPTGLVHRLKFRLLKPHAFSTSEFMCEKEFNLINRAMEVNAPFSGLYQYRSNPPNDALTPSIRNGAWFSQPTVYCDTPSDNTHVYVSSIYGVDKTPEAKGAFVLEAPAQSNSFVQQPNGTNQTAFMKWYARGESMLTSTSGKPSNTKYFKFDFGSVNTFVHELKSDAPVPLTKCTDEIVNLSPNEYAREATIAIPHYKPVFWEQKQEIYDETSLNGPSDVEITVLYVYLKLNTEIPTEKLDFIVNTFNDAIQPLSDTNLVLWELSVAETDGNGNIIYGPNGPTLK